MPLDPIGHWRRTMAVFQAADADAAELRAGLLHSLMRISPALMAANLLNATVVVVVLAGRVPAPHLALWWLLLAGYAGISLRQWLRWRQRAPQRIGRGTVRRATAGAAALGLIWGLACAVWFPLVGPEQRLLLAALTAGMLCGGAFALATLPQAALAYLGMLTACSVAALARAPGQVALQALLLCYSGVLTWMVLSAAQVATRRLQSQREARRQSQLVGLLLRDFEDHAADLLWEVGPDGRLTHAAPRLAEALGRQPGDLPALTLPELLTRRRPGPPEPPLRASDLPREASPAADAPPPPATGEAPVASRDNETLAALRDALAAGRAFSQLTVRVHTLAGARWWAITAKPLPAADGRPAGWRGVISDVTQARETHRELARLAHFDSLTGLANRIRFRDQLTRTLDDARAQPPRRCALMCLDVDHFKSINDTLGHAAGDAVLVAVAERLRSVLRAEDLPARLGGDEFALIVTEAEDPRAVQALARRLVAALAEPVPIDGQPVAIGVSLGVAIAPDHGNTLDELLAHADLALYAAKESGRGRHAVYDHKLGERRRRRLAIEQGLREAMARGELTLHWQPRVDLARWQTIGAEALLRWQHPVLGALEPAEFIRVAEGCGLIAPIGGWALAQACREAAQLPLPLVVSVNVTAAQLTRDDFFDTVMRALAEGDLPPQRLELEITESLLMDGESVAVAQLRALRQAGVRVALDDFGTGYASLAHLRRFPFDTLKIDRGFIRELTTRPDARAIVRTILELGRTLGMHTLAEGVEDTAQLECLRQAGCEAIQGYLVARPMPVAALARLLAQWPPGPDGPGQPPPLEGLRDLGPTAEPIGADAPALAVAMAPAIALRDLH